MEELGIKGAFRVTASNINLIVTSLTTELETAILQGEFENREQKMVEKALTNLSSPAIVDDLRDDIRIYIEASIARSKLGEAGSLVYLITDQFFSVFATFKVAEGILLSRVDTVMGRAVASLMHSSNLEIVMAGEVVPGMQVYTIA